MPAEWHEHEAVWLAWPSHAEEWRGNLGPVRNSVAKLARAIAGSEHDQASPAAERIEMLVLDHDGEASARALLGSTPVRFHHIPYGDVWLRDTGPVFTHRENKLHAACFAWNGWGGKYHFAHDGEVGTRIAAAASCTIDHHDVIVEGGAIDTDGEGTLLTTRQCLLHDNRNPGRDQAALEAALGRALGVEQVLWLDRGLANDHTDGHIDNLARFVAPGVVVCMWPSGPGDPNREVLGDIVRTLRGFRDAHGRALEVIDLPSPGLVRGPDGEVAPASYMNFYIGNRAVVVPVYGTANDHAAVDTLARLFPGRQVDGLDAHAVLAGGGAFHCITREQPVGRAVSQAVGLASSPSGQALPPLHPHQSPPREESP